MPDKENETSAQKKLMDEKLLEAQKKDEALKKSLKEYEEARKESIEAINNFDTSQQFEMSEEAEDKNGKLTRVLVIDTDRSGILSLMARLGNPCSVEPEKEGLTWDDDLLFKYFNAMSNIELTDANLKLIGRKAVLSARNMVTNFFTLLVVSELPEVPVTGS